MAIIWNLAANRYGRWALFTVLEARKEMVVLLVTRGGNYSVSILFVGSQRQGFRGFRQGSSRSHKQAGRIDQDDRHTDGTDMHDKNKWKLVRMHMQSSPRTTS